MVRVAARAVAQERQGVAVVFAGHHEHGGGFADVDAVAVARKRVGNAVGQHFQRGETVDGERRERVHAAAQHRVAHAQPQQPRRADERPRAGRAGGGHAVARAPQAVCRRGEIGGRGKQLRLLFERNVRPAAAIGNVLEQRDIFVCAAHRCADYHADSVRAVAAEDCLNLRLDLRQSVPQQLIVAAAVFGGQMVGERAQRAVYRAESTVFALHPFAGKRERAVFRRPQQAIQMLRQTAAQSRHQTRPAEVCPCLIHRSLPKASAAISPRRPPTRAAGRLKNRFPTAGTSP